MRPLIGIPSRSLMDKESGLRFGGLATYTRAVDLGGGTPVLIPLQLSADTLKDLYARLDGLLLAGGVDVHPKEFNEEVQPYCGEVDPARDETELCLTRWALAEGKPVFGICRGIQLLNVAAGGSLYQDISAQLNSPLGHEHRKGDPHNKLAHDVELDQGSRVAQALGATRLDVNSLHHQSLKEVAPGLRVVGRAPDGVVEAVEGTNGGFVVGVQFHPEWLLDDDARMVDLFKAFVQSAREFRIK